jgi:hypothetical protein
LPPSYSLPPLNRLNGEDAEFVYLTIYEKEGKDPEEWKVNKSDLGLYSKHNSEWT